MSTHTDRTAKTVATRQARLAKTTERMKVRTAKAQDAVARAQAALAKVQERLVQAQAKLVKVQADADALIGKQTAELRTTQEQHAKATQREQERAQKATTAKPAPSGGTVETEAGEIRPLNKSQADTIRKLVGTKRKGCFKPLDGEQAQAILSTLDANGNVGDVFQVQLKGRTTALLFSVEAEGLAFETVTVALSC